MSDSARENEQFGFDLGEVPPTVAYTPNLAEIREDLDEILSEARRVSVEDPWDGRTFRYNSIVFLQLTRWLPDAEAEQLRFDFLQEAERIERLLAA